MRNKIVSFICGFLSAYIIMWYGIMSVSHAVAIHKWESKNGATHRITFRLFSNERYFMHSLFEWSLPVHIYGGFDIE